MLKSPHFQVMVDEQGFAFCTGYQFRGLTVTPGQVGWRVIIRAYDREGDPVYAMADREEVEDCASWLFDALSGKGGGVLWHHDKFAKG